MPEEPMSAEPWSVSVIIPAYNREKYVGKAIESALAQTLPPDEVIVVDDGSADRTAEVAGRFGSPVRLIRIENTGVGPSRPRNVGIAAATSRYVTFLDSDDILLPKLLERTREAFRRAPDIGLVFNTSLVSKLSADGPSAPVPRTYRDLLASCPMRELGPDIYRIESRDAYSAYCRGNYIGTATGVTVLRAACEAVGGFDDSGELRTSNDYDFFFKVAYNYKLGYISEPLNIYYHHDQNISAANVTGDFRDYHYLNMIKVQKRQLALLLSPEDRASIGTALAECYAGVAYGYRVSRAYRKSLGSYLESLHYRLRGDALFGLLKVPAAFALDHFRDRGWVRPAGSTRPT